jgi:hypothetical protein
MACSSQKRSQQAPQHGDSQDGIDFDYDFFKDPFWWQ